MGENVFQGGSLPPHFILDRVLAPKVISGLLAKGKPGKTYSIAVVIFAVISGLILLFGLSNVNSLVSGTESGVMASVGPGIYVSIVGAIIALIGGLQKVPARPEIQQDQPPA